MVQIAAYTFFHPSEIEILAIWRGGKTFEMVGSNVMKTTFIVNVLNME